MLDDLLSDGLRLVVCGTAAGARSARLKQYYAGPGNRFWSVLAETGLTSRELRPHEAAKLLDHGIGLTDVVKGQSGADSSLVWHKASPDDVREKMLAMQPRWLCFNGKRAAQVFFGAKDVDYGVQSVCVDRTRLFVAPSTSGAARGYWDPAYWHELATLVAASCAIDEAP